MTPIAQRAELDLDYTYPQGQVGDIAHLQPCVIADQDCEAVLNIAGNVEIWFNHEKAKSLGAILDWIV